jgi:predicted amino acid racemase
LKNRYRSAWEDEVLLNVTLERNPWLIQTAMTFHREEVIPPNCFVIDMDAVQENASLLDQAAKRAGLSLYFTTKQIGLNPVLARSIVQAGISKAIAIDTREALVLSQNGIPIGHVGHLVQLPYQMISPILRLEPEVVTVFDIGKARQISEIAVRDGRHVRFLLRVVSEQDFFYPGQVGGICLEDLIEEASAIGGLPNVRIVGVTSFPCLQFDEASKTLRPTHNFHTVLKAAQILQDEMGIAIEQVNAPGNTCVGALELLAQMGATHGEPGHALTGSTYLHAQSKQAEMPAMVYVSEVSHLYGNKAYAFGGGTYRRAKVNNALVGSSPDRLARTEVLPLDPKAIDYYVALSIPPDQAIQVGDTVLVASRVQIFVSRSYVAVVQGIQSGNPSLVGLFDSSGRPVEEIV